MQKQNCQKKKYKQETKNKQIQILETNKNIAKKSNQDNKIKNNK